MNGALSSKIQTSCRPLAVKRTGSLCRTTRYQCSRSFSSLAEPPQKRRKVLICSPKTPLDQESGLLNLRPSKMHQMVKSDKDKAWELDYLRRKAQRSQVFRKAQAEKEATAAARVDSKDNPSPQEKVTLGRRQEIQERGRSLLGIGPHWRPNKDHSPAMAEETEEERNVRESSLTDRERATFRRLLAQITKKPSPAAEERMMRDRIDKDELYDFEHDLDADNMPVPDENAIGAFPPDLREAATLAFQETIRRNFADRPSLDPYVQKARALALPVRERLLSTENDIHVWRIVEEELFEKYRAYGLDAGTPEMVKKNIKEGQRITGMSLPVFSYYYQRLLLVAQRILCRRTMYTPLAFALLPAIKHQGTSSYTMGISPGLFNELIRYNWRVHNTMTPVLALLTEMDRMLCPMNVLTLDILEEITHYRRRAERGDFGLANRSLERTPRKIEEGERIWQWKQRIQDEFEASELDKVRRKEQEQALLREGALSEDSDPEAIMPTSFAS